MEDVLYSHSSRLKIQDLLLVLDRFIFLTRDKDGRDGNCICPTTFRRKLEATIATNTTFCVAIQRYGEDMATLRLHPRDEMEGPTQFKLLSPMGVPSGSPSANKLEIKDTMELKLVATKNIPSLSCLADIQRWCNALNSRGRVCDVYTTPWEHFSKKNRMGATWHVLSVSQEVLDRQDIMSVALHSLLSSAG
jgi:hypothetical protein